MIMMSVQHYFFACRSVVLLVLFLTLLIGQHHHQAAAASSPFGTRIVGIGSPAASWHRSGTSHRRGDRRAAAAASSGRSRSKSDSNSNLLDFDDQYDSTAAEDHLLFLEDGTQASNGGIRTTQPCHSIGNTLLRGAALRIASDLSGGTPLENIKTRVTITKLNFIQATRQITANGGIGALWTGSPSRTVEGALIGAVFMLGSVATKTQLKRLGAPPTIAALAGGLVGGVAQAAIMTPAGLIFTTLNNQQQSGTSSSSSGSHEGTIAIIRRVISEKGIGGMYSGGGAMCLRQATNWASRSGFTEIARSVFKLQQYGILGEIASGTIGGVGSCWNTPIETIRVVNHRDVSKGLEPKTMGQYWNDIFEESGYPGLFRGITPRAVQAVWQTVFLVVVPNIMGI